jgi:hypothetical protein
MAVIAGRVVDARGQPVAGAAVYVVSAPSPQPDIAPITDADGRFTLGADAVGAYVLGARSDTAGEGRTSVTLTDPGDTADVRILVRRS